MILNAIRVTDPRSGEGAADRAVAAFLRFIERKLGVAFVRERSPAEDEGMAVPERLAAALRQEGVITKTGRFLPYPDEPPTRWWYAICADEAHHQTGGLSWDSDAEALTPALAEALERYIWSTQNDYFRAPVTARESDIALKGAYLSPGSVAGFTDAQRVHDSRALRPDAEYLWVQGSSLTDGTPVYVPAQLVSARAAREGRTDNREPVIRQTTTNGLATWTTRTGAELAGALEVIEREAYMVMWLNQLSLPRIDLSALRARNDELDRHIASCERYGLRVHAVQLITDAPTHAIMAVVEDLSGRAPRFTVGLKAHRSLSRAIDRAVTEALRSRSGFRFWADAGNNWDPSTSAEKIGHRDRLYYWSLPEHADALRFMIDGPIVDPAVQIWDTDSEEAHLARIAAWCRTNGIPAVSVPLTHSKKNTTGLHIAMVILPTLQSTYLHERLQSFGGDRWHTLPKMFGYTPRKTPFSDAPHPFS